MRLSIDDEDGHPPPSVARLDRAVEDILAHLKMPPLDSYSSQPMSVLLPESQSQAQAQMMIQGQVQPQLLPQPLGNGLGQGQGHQQQFLAAPEPTSQSQTTRENSREPGTAGDDLEMAPAPMGSLYEVTQLNTLRSRLKYGDPARRNSKKNLNMEQDLVSLGLITLAEAEDLFSLFKTTLSRYLFDATIQESRTLLSVRESSTLFFTAIITVTSLHIPGREKTYALAHKHLRDLIATSFFDRFHTLEDVRALCIAAFWLPDLSWKLSGHCVRMATELNLHQAFYKAFYSPAALLMATTAKTTTTTTNTNTAASKLEHLERARLWYLLYVLDHHFSIAYGRPPVTAELQAIKEYDVFLNASECTPSDRRVLSQVTLFIILSRAYNHFGLEAERLMDGDDGTLTMHARFMEELDRWRYQFRHALNRDAHIGDYPAVGKIHSPFLPPRTLPQLLLC
jgi:hypothetical protein